VKLADDGSGDVIVRLHEATGNRVRTTIVAPRRVTAASACDLLENPQRHFEVSDGIVALTLRPFELVTLRLTLERPGWV
jgi:alpha-mannosidase